LLDARRCERVKSPLAMSRSIAAALLVVVLLAGCGGNDEPKTMSKARYIVEGDLVCAELTGRLADAGAADPQTPEAIRQSADTLADVYGDLRQGLQDIRLPTDPAERRGAAAYLAAVGQTDPALARLRSSAQRFVAAAQAKNSRELTEAGNAVRKALDTFRAAQAEANTRALAYGFQQCGNLS
jgi:hypothetical protein